MQLRLKIYTLIILTGVVFFSCKKHETSKAAPTSYTLNMGGMRQWRGTYHYQCLSCSPVENGINNVSDSFGIAVVDTSIIIAENYCANNNYYTNLYFSSSNDTTHTLLFLSQPYNDSFQLAITYYYLKDSMSYINVLIYSGQENDTAYLHTL